MTYDIHHFNKLEIIYLSNQGSTGNTFFLSLLDGHEQILNLPGYVDLNFILKKENSFENYLKKFYSNNPFFFNTTKMTITSKNHQGLFFLGENCNEGLIIDKDLFNKHFKNFTKNIDVSEKNFIYAFYYSYAKAINKNIDRIKYLVIYAYDHNSTLKFINLLGSGKILVLSRNIFNNYFSFEKKILTKSNLRNEDKNLMLNDALTYLYNTSKNVTPLILAKVKFRIIKIEDLHREPEKIIKNFCISYDIKYNELLLHSSFIGKKYNGHSWNYEKKKLKKFFGFNKDYHMIDNINNLRKIEHIQILFIGYFYLVSLNYINKKRKFFLLRNFFYIFILSKYENELLKKNFNLKFLFFIIKLRLKYFFTFFYQFINIKKITESIIKI